VEINFYHNWIRPYLKSIFWASRNGYFKLLDSAVTDVPPVAVIGCGRSGTNMVLEILSGHTQLSPTTPDPEDKRLFVPGRRLSPRYLTKCDTHYGSVDALGKLVNLNTRLKIIWTIRDPRDICLSKLRRGVTIDQGGDCEVAAEDSTDSGCINSIVKMADMHRFVIDRCPERVMTVRMENVIEDVEKEARRLSTFLELEFERPMCEFPSRMRNEQKKSRYGNLVDSSQVGIWRDLQTAYGGYFSARSSRVLSMFSELEEIIRYFDYN